MDIIQEKIEAKLTELRKLDDSRSFIIRDLLDLGREQGREGLGRQDQHRGPEAATAGPSRAEATSSPSEEAFEKGEKEDLAEAVYRMAHSLNVLREQQGLQEDRGLLIAAGVLVLGVGVAVWHRFRGRD